MLLAIRNGEVGPEEALAYRGELVKLRQQYLDKASAVDGHLELIDAQISAMLD